MNLEKIADIGTALRDTRLAREECAQQQRLASRQVDDLRLKLGELDDLIYQLEVDILKEVRKG